MSDSEHDRKGQDLRKVRCIRGPEDVKQARLDEFGEKGSHERYYIRDKGATGLCISPTDPRLLAAKRLGVTMVLGDGLEEDSVGEEGKCVCPPVS